MKKRSASGTSTRGRSMAMKAPRRGMKPATTSKAKNKKQAAPRATTTKTRAKTSATRAGSSRVGAKVSPGSRTGKVTTDHERIRKWAETRGGKPAAVKGTARGKQSAGIIRLDFPGYSGGKSLRPISWEQWFEQFEDRRLALLYQDRTAQGKPSRFNKLVARK